MSNNNFPQYRISKGNMHVKIVAIHSNTSVFVIKKYIRNAAKNTTYEFIHRLYAIPFDFTLGKPCTEKEYLTMLDDMICLAMKGGKK